MDVTNLPAAVDDRDSAGRRLRHDGWTGARQKGFLERIAEGFTVDEACRAVGMGPASAYAFRRRAAGAEFAVGWTAANLLAREKLGATLYARAVDGFSETVTRPDGSTYTRHRFDNRLALSLLTRLDGAARDAGGDAHGAAARLVAQEFEAFLELIGAEDGPARAGLFLAARAGPAADMGPIAALARADAFLRAGKGLAGEVDVSDLDPGDRAGWSAEDWRRAEAAGLVALAPEGGAQADDAHMSPLSPLVDADPEDGEDPPVWWDPRMQSYLTHFPPPPGFYGQQEGKWGEPGYCRTLMYDEAERARVRLAVETGPELPTLVEAEAARKAWFAAASGETGEAEAPRGAHEDAKARRVDELLSACFADLGVGDAPEPEGSHEGTKARRGETNEKVEIKSLYPRHPGESRVPAACPAEVAAPADEKKLDPGGRRDDEEGQAGAPEPTTPPLRAFVPSCEPPRRLPPAPADDAWLRPVRPHRQQHRHSIGTG